MKAVDFSEFLIWTSKDLVVFIKKYPTVSIRVFFASRELQWKLAKLQTMAIAAILNVLICDIIQTCL